MDVNFENYTTKALNDVLLEFYAAVQSTKVGREYNISSSKSMRAGINRHLMEVNIITDTRFKT